MPRIKTKLRDPSGIDWQNMDRLADLGRAFRPVDPPTEGDHKAQAGTKAAYVTQLPIDAYRASGVLTPQMYDAAQRIYGYYVRAMSTGGPSWDGVYVQSSGPRSVTDHQLRAYDELRAVMREIPPDAAVVVRWIVLASETIHTTRKFLTIGEARCKALLRDGLEAAAKFYGLVK